ncbi:MAG: hypothetical protein IKK09_12160 [Clostridia bacterium]|nr:hypothetical protein [Clostridia bacterium]
MLICYHKDKRCVSLTADAIHIVNTDGCFNISGCDISSMGDDAINVHDGLGYVSGVNGNTLTLIASATIPLKSAITATGVA